MKVPIFLTLDQLQGDLTQFLQQSVVFKTDQEVVVYLDPLPMYFHNPEFDKYHEEKLLYELGSNEKPVLPTVTPILTLKGVAAVRKQVVSALGNEPESDEWEEVEDWK